MKTSSHHSTGAVSPRGNPFVKLVLVAASAVLPLQDHLGSIGGFSVVYLVFLVLGVMAALSRPAALLLVARSSVCIAMYVLLAVAAVLEALHSMSNYLYIWRILQMVIGGVLIGAFALNRAYARSALLGLVAGGTWFSLLILPKLRGGVAEVEDADFNTVSRARFDAWQEVGILANPNSMALVAGAGATISLAFALRAKSRASSIVYFALFAICFTGTFLTMSRGGIASTVGGCLVVLVATGARRALLALAVGGALLMAAVPSAVFSRLTFSTEYVNGKMEGRARLYSVFVEQVPAYVVRGVGAGNYEDHWAIAHGLEKDGNPYGAHNIPLQFLVNWGFVALAGVGVVGLAAFLSLRKKAVTDVEIAVKAFAAMLMLRSMVTHMFYGKEFALGVGLICAYALWSKVPGRVPASRRAAAVRPKRLPAAPPRLTPAAAPLRTRIVTAGGESV